MSQFSSVKAAYQAELEAKGFKSDPAQLRAVEALDRCAREWAAYKTQRSNARRCAVRYRRQPLNRRLCPMNRPHRQHRLARR